MEYHYEDGPPKVLLIANRGEIVLRIAKSARELGFIVITVFGDDDRHSPHRTAGDRSINLSQLANDEGRSFGQDSHEELSGPALYLDEELMIRACRLVDATHVHPGYGLLSERASFADQVLSAKMIWVGPSPEAMRKLGDKGAAREIAERLGIPLVPGFAKLGASDHELTQAGSVLGVPLMIKSTAGGGGRGMRVVYEEDDLIDAILSARREARLGFGDEGLILERFIPTARHIEVQIFGDESGELVHIGERDCSLQRRQQKLVEETPAPNLDSELLKDLYRDALKIAKELGYTNAGTVEFLVSPDGSYYFLEVNTRIQVEHVITELLYEIDIVKWQLLISDGASLPLSQEELYAKRVSHPKHVIELRLCAETPDLESLPQSGPVMLWYPPRFAERVETAIGGEISALFDSMIAKLVFCGASRNEAISKAVKGLKSLRLIGVSHNAPLLLSLIDHPDFRAVRHHTRWFNETFGSLERTEPNEILALRLRERAALSALILSTPLRLFNDRLEECNSHPAWSSNGERLWYIDIRFESAQSPKYSPVTWEDQSYVIETIRDPHFESCTYRVRELKAPKMDQEMNGFLFVDLWFNNAKRMISWRDRFGMSHQVELYLCLESGGDHPTFDPCPPSKGESFDAWSKRWEQSEWNASSKRLWLIEEELTDTRVMTSKLSTRLGQSTDELKGRGQVAKTLRAPMTGRLSKRLAMSGERLKPGEPIAMLESMKLEYPLSVSSTLVLSEWLVNEGDPVRVGQELALLNEDL